MEGTTNINLLHHFLASIHVHLIIFDHLVQFVGGYDWVGGRLSLRRMPCMVVCYSFSAKWPAPRFTILFLPRVRSLPRGQSSSSPALSQLYSENWPEEDGRLIFPYISPVFEWYHYLLKYVRINLFCALLFSALNDLYIKCARHLHLPDLSPFAELPMVNFFKEMGVNFCPF